MPDECMTEGVDLFPDTTRQRLIADDPRTLLALRFPGIHSPAFTVPCCAGMPARDRISGERYDPACAVVEERPDE